MLVHSTKTTSEEETSSEEYFDVEPVWEANGNGTDESTDTDENEFFNIQASSVVSNLESLKNEPFQEQQITIDSELRYSRELSQSINSVSLVETLDSIPPDFRPRVALPKFRNEDIKLSIAKFFKDAIGKDLTRITMPAVS